MKKYFTLILVALLPMLASAYDACINGIYYNFISENEAEVTYLTYFNDSGWIVQDTGSRSSVRANDNVVYDSNSDVYFGAVVIPESVVYYGNTYRVTRIGFAAFKDCCNLTSITIPSSITTIDCLAFTNCTGLEKVIVPDLKAWCNISFLRKGYGYIYTDVSNPLIYAHHIYDKYNLEIKDLVIPSGVTTINRAFNGCSSLTSVTIPSSVTSIGDAAFEGCSSLTSVTIPNSVTSIGDAAFYGCSGLTSVIIPNNVTSIAESRNYSSGAFCGCSSLTSVTLNSDAVVSAGRQPLYSMRKIFGDQVTEYIIGNGVTSIGGYAFYDCTGLTSVTIPNSVTSIGYEAFYYCYNLTSVTIGNGVTSIGESAFRGCRGLTHVTLNSDAVVSAKRASQYSMYKIFGDQVTEYIIGNSVTSIGESAFMGCRGLKSVTIGSGVTNIGESAFRGCYFIYDTFVNNSSLSAEDNKYWGATLYDGKETNDGLLIIDDAVVICRPWVTSVTIPNSVTSISDYTFFCCNGLTSVTIGNSVTSISDGAFYRCTNLTDVYCLAENVPKTDSKAFNSSPIESATLHVPASALETYKNTYPWSGFGTIVALTEIIGDLNSDAKVDIADAVTVLNIMAEGNYSEVADVNGDDKVDIADFVTILNIMAAQ